MPVMIVLPELANRYGVNQAIVLAQLHYWLGRATVQEEERWWVYKSVSEWSEEFSWWSRSTVHKLFGDLAEKGLVLVRQDGSGPKSHTYYSIDYEALTEACRAALVMLSEIRTIDPPQVSEIRTVSSENRTVSSENRTVHIYRSSEITTEITTESTIEGGERTPARVLRTDVPAAKTLHHHSPYLRDAPFDESGRIPPGRGANPVQVYYERFEIRHDRQRLSTIQEDDLVRGCPDLDRLRGVIIAYSRAGHRPGNINLILDWYADPSRYQPPARAAPYANGTGPPTKVQASLDAVDYVFDRLRQEQSSHG